MLLLIRERDFSISSVLAVKVILTLFQRLGSSMLRKFKPAFHSFVMSIVTSVLIVGPVLQTGIAYADSPVGSPEAVNVANPVESAENAGSSTGADSSRLDSTGASADSKTTQNIEASESPSTQNAGESSPDSLVENSWRYKDGQLSISDNGIATMSLGDDSLPTGATARGIDVSNWQGTIDWAKVKASGIKFVFLKVGPVYGKIDASFERNASECERLGIPYGVYYYTYARSTADAARDASRTLSWLGSHHPTLPVYYDVEDNYILQDPAFSKQKLADSVRTFCNTVSGAGFKTGIYANLNWFNNYLNSPELKGYDRWVAQYNYRCDYKGSYSFWQYSASGSVPGIGGSIDMNYSYIHIVTNEDRWKSADELAAAHASDLPDGTYTISSAKLGSSVLEAKGGRTSNGTAVSLYSANGTVAQAWTVSHEGDYVVIRNAKSGRAIDPTGPSSDPGTKLQLWDASGTRPQRWIAVRQADGTYEFRSALDPDVAFDLTAGKTSNGTRAQLYGANGTAAQRWKLKGL